MSRKLQLLLILCLVLALTSAASHVTTRYLGIKATWGGYKYYGTNDLRPATVLHGSSPAYDGLDWTQISEALGGAIESWATAGSSPAEWEVMQHRSHDVTRAFIVVTPIDLNEYYLCDFRADIVPFGETLRDLWRCDVDWQFSRRLLSQYPTMVVRKIFPTVGRSDGVMVGIRTKLLKFARISSNTDAGDAPKFGAVGKSEIKEKISDWSTAHIERVFVLLRTACMGKHSFNGPKKRALLRLLQKTGAQGEIGLVVLPVSPIYQQAFLTSAVMRDFDDEIAEAKRYCPKLQIVRIDQLAVLNDNNLFYDPVHLNMFGQHVATEAFLSRLKALEDANH